MLLWQPILYYTCKLVPSSKSFSKGSSSSAGIEYTTAHSRPSASNKNNVLILNVFWSRFWTLQQFPSILYSLFMLIFQHLAIFLHIRISATLTQAFVIFLFNIKSHHFHFRAIQNLSISYKHLTTISVLGMQINIIQVGRFSKEVLKRTC